ncbi:hypothetical protein [Owenweeksia hongkongensis]|uniref:hypothetical protein n=1 Tax=Owenweeksia hongkongensis TaxID=253245 RepID=UPI003A92BDA2
MNVVFNKWIEIDVNHSYFGDDGFGSFEIHQLGNTYTKMKNYKLVGRKLKNTFCIYNEDDASQTYSEGGAKGIGSLAFSLNILDRAFFNYTDVPFPNDSELILFYNEASSMQNQGNSIALVSALISKYSQILPVKLPSGEVTVEIKPFGELQGKVMKVPKDADRYFEFPLQGFESGVAELLINGKQIECFYISDERNINGIKVLIHLNIENVCKKFCKFNLNFDVKKIYLEYKIVNRKLQNMEVIEANIIGSNDDNYMDEGFEAILNDAKAQVFISKGPVDLRLKLEQRPKLKLTYLNGFSKSVKTMEMTLPDPDVDNIVKYKNGPKNSWLASTIVYV